MPSTSLRPVFLPFARRLKSWDPTVALCLSLICFLGVSGIDRMYIGDIGLGIGKLITGGGCGIWSLIDLFLIMGATKEKNYQQFIQNVSYL